METESRFQNELLNYHEFKACLTSLADQILIALEKHTTWIKDGMKELRMYHLMPVYRDSSLIRNDFINIFGFMKRTNYYTQDEIDDYQNKYNALINKVANSEEDNSRSIQ